MGDAWYECLRISAVEGLLSMNYLRSEMLYFTPQLRLCLVFHIVYNINRSKGFDSKVRFLPVNKGQLFYPLCKVCHTFIKN